MLNKDEIRKVLNPDRVSGPLKEDGTRDYSKSLRKIVNEMGIKS